MRSFWEQSGVLGPIYRLLGRGLNNEDIGATLNITQERVEGCIAWLLHFLTLKNRQDLVLYASSGK
jgi:DNA-binding NarL/FixJ family response regulator